ncbi:MAG: hypothetical protein AAGG08_05540 [Actinomycetota bacterium]
MSEASISSPVDDVAALPGITIGVTGARPRWTVTPWGAVQPWSLGDDAAAGSLDWHVAADDRWHRPADEPTTRQRRLEGTPVVETRVKVPDGEVVQRIWGIPDAGGLVVVEFENASSLPLAVAVHGDSIRTERPPADVPVEGIDLPDDTIVLPIGHRSTVRVVLGRVRSVPTIPPHLSVVRGWTRVVEQASRLVLPDAAVAEAMVSARSDLLLAGPVDADTDPVGFLLDVGELVRCGDDAEGWLIEMIEPLETLLAEIRPSRWRRLGRRDANDPSATPSIELVDAVAAVRRAAARARDERALADTERLLADLPSPDPAPPFALSDLRRDDADGGSIGRFVRRVERRFADAGDLLPGGIPSAWLGADFEVHGIPTSPTSSVGYALRWHGERPAVLWEQDGAVELTARSVDADWSTSEARGEALWNVPANAKLARRRISFTVEGVSRDGD